MIIVLPFIVHADNRKKDILIPGKSPTDRLDDTTVTAEIEYSIISANKNFDLTYMTIKIKVICLLME